MATRQIKEFDGSDKIFLGELALDGQLRPVNGALNIAQMALQLGFKYIFLPAKNANEAAAIAGIVVIPVADLRSVIDFLEDRMDIAPAIFSPLEAKAVHAPDLGEVKGQDSAKRALTIAAAGAHNILMIGPPGVGKSLLAQTLIGILPDPERQEAIEITKIWSAAGMSPGGLMRHRPFRAPHQTASLVAIVGGGQDPKPGEISLAHRGILFLDEVPEFQKNVLEALRQPIESGTVHIARAKHSLVFPAKFTLVAAMNPCPCGYYGQSDRDCKCSAYEIIKYQKKISGPLLDRIDLQIKVGRINIDELRSIKAESAVSPLVKRQIETARQIQSKRFAKLPAARRVSTNADMSSREVEKMISFEPSADGFLKTLNDSHLSPSGYYRLLKVARTIADLEEKESVSSEHLAEAFSYRLKAELEL